MRSLRALGALALLACAGTAAAADDITLQLLGRYETGVFADGGSEIVAHDAGTQRLFVTNGSSKMIDAIDISDPSNPTLAFSIDLSPWGAGANSVAVRDGLVAAAIEAETSTDPGVVGFFDADGGFLASVQVGALPDMLIFTPDGSRLLVANEGEPSDDYTIDPEGSVSIITIPGDITTISQDDVATAGFGAFSKGELPGSVRIFGPGASVAQDLEPEYIAVSADSLTAWVVCQENNALAIVDVASASVTEIVGLGLKQHALGTAVLTLSPIELPVLGVTKAGQEIRLGGFSGLYFDGLVDGRWRFLTHPDRGPNADTMDVDGDGVNERPFPLPDYQSRIVVLEYDPATNETTIVDEIFLTRGDGVTPISGISNIADDTVDPDGPAAGFAHADEEPVDIFGSPLAYDPLGGDFEGVVRTDDGSLWLVDEYRPALYRFDASGVLMARYVPEGATAFGPVGVEAFPAVYAQRRLNRGFEAVAQEGGSIFCFIQSPIDNPDTANDQSSKDSSITRILEFDIASETVVGDYAYVIDGDGSDKIGDAVTLRPGEMLVIERDSAVGEDTQKNVYHIDLSDATNLLDLPAEIVGPGGSLELTAPEDLADIGVTPVAKTLYVNLAAAGYDFSDKPEGLAMIEPGVLAVINDNDFQLAGGLDLKTGLVDFLDEPQPVALAVVRFEGAAFDASNEDGVVHLQNWPTMGMYQPDGIAAYDVDGETFIVSANEGDARDYDGFSEEARVKDLALDVTAFPTRINMLQDDEQLGRLKTTTVNGDLDGDGDYDAIYSYGARSFSIWNASGELVWDSGEALERITSAALPDDFNSDDEENGSFDDRSDDKGPEPEGVAIGMFGDRTYAFVGLERVGGIVVYNVTDPTAPTFVQYLNTRDFGGVPEDGTAGDLSPEGLAVIAAEDSPTGQPLLAVGYEVSGTTTLYSILTPCAGDFNRDGELTILDFVQFQLAWQDEAPAADCNEDGAFDLTDFVCFQTAFQAGCR